MRQRRAGGDLGPARALRDDTSSTVASVSYTVVSGGGSQGASDVDCTNRLCGQTSSGNPVLIVARCTDPKGRQYEVELSFAFAL